MQDDWDDEITKMTRVTKMTKDLVHGFCQKFDFIRQNQPAKCV